MGEIKQAALALPGAEGASARLIAPERPAYLAELNAEQCRAAMHGSGSKDAVQHGAPPLLIIAGAGSGKTNTLAHRVAHLIQSGADPRRILLLTFTRRAAQEMTRRAERLVAHARASDADAAGRPSRAEARPGQLAWSGTFHSVANRLLRYHAESVGLDPAFTVLDRADAADLMNLERNDLGLAQRSSRFPRKGTCLSIYSHAVNAQQPVEATLASAFPWCEQWAEELKGLFRAYVAKKQAHNVLDYDDLLLYWFHLMADPALAERVGDRFDHVLVDEYQDTNALQAAILLAMKPTGRGLTVVGDDAQSIYAFRAASIRNILDFPQHFEPAADVVTLERNYRSTQPILTACNAVIDQAAERYSKQLHSDKVSDQKPILATVEDENEQVDYVIEAILAHREQGIDLKRQAVLMRTAHHSDPLEVELSRRNIPFVKFGGLKFLEAAHVKDLLSLLRLAENPRDAIAAFRVLQLLPGVGPGHARRAIDHLAAHQFDLAAWRNFRPPTAAAQDWRPLCALLERLRDPDTEWAAQVGLARVWYTPHVERLYDSAHVRLGDIEQLEQISTAYATRERFLTELTLDPPDATGDEAGEPLLDEDYLILSTIHSSKGQEWDVVYVLNAADGCIPSDMSTGKPEQIDEERRLLYVAMTRARDHLHVIHPLRFFKRQQHRHGDAHVMTPRTRFIPEPLLAHFERAARGRAGVGQSARGPGAGRASVRVDVGAKLRDMWQ